MKILVKIISLTVVSFVIPFIVLSQSKLLTIEDLVTNYALYPSSLKQLQWMGKSDYFSYVTNDAIIRGNISSEKKDTILKLKDINDKYTTYKKPELERFPNISWITEKQFIFSDKEQLFSYDIPTASLKSLNKFDEKADNTDIEENTFAIAYTIENNLYVSINGNAIQVTDDKKGIVNGQAVHRNEFGIEKGTFWSSKGNLLAFYRMDETMVTDYPLVNIEARIAETENIKYPMAGMKSHEVTVGIFNITAKKTIFLNTGEPKEQYLTNITWSPDEKYIYMAVLNRDQNHLKLNQYDVATGNFVKTLFEEKDDKYVEPEHGLYFLKKNPNQFVWFSERDGYNHLYLYDTDGKLIKQLTKGEWVVNELTGVDENEKYLFFTSTKESPIEKHIYQVDLQTTDITKLSSAKGTHEALLNNKGNYLLDFYSSTTIPYECLLIDYKGNATRTIHKSDNPLKDYKLGEATIFTIKGDDNTDLYCRMIKPPDFKPTEQYPVIIYVYGGPHLQMVTDVWFSGSTAFFLNYMAQKGYVIFSLDNRGSANRGMKFEQAIFRNLGTAEIQDQLKGIEYLRQQPFIDGDRIGIHGWSYGGFLTTAMMLKHPRIFTAGVAGGPVIDWKYYEVMYGERYMDTPEDNPDGYKNANLLNYVKDLKGKLLIIHGTVDPTVVWQHSLAFVKKCVDENIQLDYFVYPGHEHNIKGKDRIHLFRKIEMYFDDYL